MIGEVCDFENGFLFGAALCADYHLRALLSHFLENFVNAFIEKIGGIGAFLRVGLSARYQFVKSVEGKLFERVGSPHEIVETTVGAEMTGGAVLDNFDHKSVEIAIGGNGDDVLIIAAGFTFQPKFLAEF